VIPRILYREPFYGACSSPGAVGGGGAPADTFLLASFHVIVVGLFLATAVARDSFLVRCFHPSRSPRLTYLLTPT
jgi:hypothetical protein